MIRFYYLIQFCIDYEFFLFIFSMGYYYCDFFGKVEFVSFKILELYFKVFQDYYFDWLGMITEY